MIYTQSYTDEAGVQVLRFTRTEPLVINPYRRLNTDTCHCNAVTAPSVPQDNLADKDIRTYLDHDTLNEMSGVPINNDEEEEADETRVPIDTSRVPLSRSANSRLANAVDVSCDVEPTSTHVNCYNSDDDEVTSNSVDHIFEDSISESRYYYQLLQGYLEKFLLGIR